MDTRRPSGVCVETTRVSEGCAICATVAHQLLLSLPASSLGSSPSSVLRPSCHAAGMLLLILRIADQDAVHGTDVSCVRSLTSRVQLHPPLQVERRFALKPLVTRAQAVTLLRAA